LEKASQDLLQNGRDLAESRRYSPVNGRESSRVRQNGEKWLEVRPARGKKAFGRKSNNARPIFG